MDFAPIIWLLAADEEKAPAPAGGLDAMAFLPFIAIAVIFYVLLIRPQRRRQLDQQRLIDSLEVGKEIVTAGGLYGTVTALDHDEVHMQIADGVEVRIAKRAVAGILPGDEPEELEEETPGTLSGQ